VGHVIGHDGQGAVVGVYLSGEHGFKSLERVYFFVFASEAFGVNQSFNEVGFHFGPFKGRVPNHYAGGEIAERGDVVFNVDVGLHGVAFLDARAVVDGFRGLSRSLFRESLQ